MIKPIAVVVVLILAYVVFFKDPYPSSVVFDSHTLSNKKDENTAFIQTADIFSYRDSGSDRVLVFGMANDSMAVGSMAAQYLSLFKSQGVKFKKSGERYLGVKADEVIYMAKASAINAVIVYLIKAPANIPSSIDDASMMFIELESFTF